MTAAATPGIMRPSCLDMVQGGPDVSDSHLANAASTSSVACLSSGRGVLFPGQNHEATAPRWPALLILLILPGLLLYPCLSFYLFEPDEGRYAEILREMLLHGEWLVPYLQSEPYFDKPPLLYWLVMLSYSLFGVHDWSGAWYRRWRCMRPFWPST